MIGLMASELHQAANQMESFKVSATWEPPNCVAHISCKQISNAFSCPRCGERGERTPTKARRKRGSNLLQMFGHNRRSFDS